MAMYINVNYLASLKIWIGQIVFTQKWTIIWILYYTSKHDDKSNVNNHLIAQLTSWTIISIPGYVSRNVRNQIHRCLYIRKRRLVRENNIIASNAYKLSAHINFGSRSTLYQLKTVLCFLTNILKSWCTISKKPLYWISYEILSLTEY